MFPEDCKRKRWETQYQYLMTQKKMNIRIQVSPLLSPWSPWPRCLLNNLERSHVLRTHLRESPDPMREALPCRSQWWSPETFYPTVKWWIKREEETLSEWACNKLLIIVHVMILVLVLKSFFSQVIVLWLVQLNEIWHVVASIRVARSVHLCPVSIYSFEGLKEKVCRFFKLCVRV